MNKCLFFLTILFLVACNQKKSNNSSSDHEYTNALINESSPYLLQHAHNPVNWRPWGQEALDLAKKENKLIIISVGYAACHWCHVMEHESFEDTLVAKIMNENFVCIKVDREERPDVDDVYMSACQLIKGGGCGWPLNAFALPDGRPVWAGTYFPKDQWTKILEQFKNINETDHDKLVESADQLTKGIISMEEIDLVTEELEYTKNELDDIAEKFLSNIDFEEGGRKGEPKFPMPNNYEFLLKYFHFSGNQKALDAVYKTLDKMAMGGIYDQLGGGFARYSVDGIWMVPHFEKMLYDNGQLISLYANAYKLSKKPLYKKIVDETIEFCLRELGNAEGGFYSSLDADSEGEEGKFYVWTKSEIDSIIGDKTKANIFNEYFSIEENGNWEHHNILHISDQLDDILKKNKISEKELNQILEDCKSKLFAHRSDRIRPGTDDKTLSSWNGLMLRGLVEAYKATGNKKYKELASKSADFLEKHQIQEEYRLNRNFKNGKSTINGFLDDYATVIDGLMGMYQISFDETYLVKAEKLTKYAMDHFFNDESKMFNYASDLDPPLVAKKSEIADNVIPASNSMMARNLNTLGTYLYKPEYLNQSKQMMNNVMEQLVLTDTPNFYSNWCSLYLELLNPPYEIAILGENYETLRSEMATTYLPNAVLLGGNSEGTMDLLKDKLQEDQTLIYVCQNKVCKFPVDNVEAALNLMK